MRAVTQPRDAEFVWLKEEGRAMPPVLAVIEARGHRVMHYGLDERNIKHRRWFSMYRAAWTVLNVTRALIFHRRARAVVGTHYAGLLYAILSSWVLPRATRPRAIIYLFFPSSGRGWLGTAREALHHYGLRHASAIIVNSEQQLSELREDKRSANLRMAYFPDALPHRETASSQKQDYVFAGGESGRDWSRTRKIVEMMPACRFVIVCPPQWRALFAPLANADVFSGIDLEDFNRRLRDARVALVLLESNSVAGITIVQEAQTHGVLVIAGDNLHLRSYIEHGVDGILARDDDAIVSWITRAMETPGEDVASVLENARVRVANKMLGDDVRTRRLAAFIEDCAR